MISKIAFIITLFALLVFSCKQTPVPKSKETVAEPPALCVDLYLDGSLSMIGFITLGDDRYSDFLQKLENILISRFKTEKIAYFKFGDSVLETDRQRFRDATISRKYYEDKLVCNRTELDSLILKLDLNHLSLIITDLYQKQADVNAVILAIQDRNLMEDYSIGFFGLRSNFNGYVYDLGLGTSASEYHGPRPFYLLAIGAYQEMKKLFECLYENPSSSEIDNVLFILSPCIPQEPASFENGNILKISGLQETRKWQGKKVEANTKVFKIRGGASRATYFTVSCPLEQLPYNPTFNYEDYYLKINSQYCPPTSKQFNPSSASQSIIKMTVLPVSKPELLDFRFNIDRNKLLIKGDYSWEIFAKLRQNAFELPAWISEWNLNSNEAFRGSKTLNLFTFINSLWCLYYESNQPQLAYFKIIISN